MHKSSKYTVQAVISQLLTKIRVDSYFLASTSKGISYAASVIPNIICTEVSNAVVALEHSNSFSVSHTNSGDVFEYWNSILHPGESVWW